MRLFLKNAVFVLLVPGLVTTVVPWKVAALQRSVSCSLGSPTQWLALLPLVTACIGMVWCTWHFAVTGGGTPAPIDAPKRLVVMGPYRLVRNPMYATVILAELGWALFFWSWAVLALGMALWAGFHLFVVLYEEPHLRAVFGDDYVTYCGHVRRWAPRIVRRSSPEALQPGASPRSDG